MAKSEIHPKCKVCKPAKCCMYISLEIPPPKTKKDFHEILWYIIHKNVSVYIYKRKWHLNFDSPCEHLGKDSLCTIYDSRTLVCRQYEPTHCPANDNDGYDFEYEFKTKEDFMRYLEKRRIKI